MEILIYVDNDIKLKKFYIDEDINELCFSNFKENFFEPEYQYYIYDNKFIIEIYLPEKLNILKLMHKKI